MKIILSIADIPLNIKIETLFAVASSLGFDGVEIVLGFRTFSPIKKLERLSQKYQIPIVSIHHPFSLINHIVSSDSAFETARHFGAIMVVHPLAHVPIKSPQQEKYLNKISQQSKKYKVKIALENMPKQKNIPVLKYFSSTDTSTTKLSSILEASRNYKFGVTLDTCHLETPDISILKDFESIYPELLNVHLSDYTDVKQHLALGDGKLHYRKLLQYFKKRSYKGLITIELSPKVLVSKTKYLEEIKDSFKRVTQATTTA